MQQDVGFTPRNVGFTQHRMKGDEPWDPHSHSTPPLHPLLSISWTPTRRVSLRPEPPSPSTSLFI